MMKVEIILKARGDGAIYCCEAVEDPIDCVAACPICPEDASEDLEWCEPIINGMYIGAVCQMAHEFIRQDTPMSPDDDDGDNDGTIE